jgi:hypothetical protein
VSASKRGRKREKVQGGDERTTNFEIRSGTEWDFVVEKSRDPGDGRAPDPPSSPANDTGNHIGGWLGVPSAAPAAEAILANLMSRVQKLEMTVQRLETQLAEHPDAPTGPRAVG